MRRTTVVVAGGVGLAVAVVLALRVITAIPRHAEVTRQQSGSRPDRYQGWTCMWTEESAPLVRPADADGACSGAVVCRHESIRTLVPQIHKVDCKSKAGVCNATACLRDSD
jgi:hypothetical protein